MLGSRHEIARLQSDFFRDKFRKELRWLIYSIAILIVLVVSVCYMILTRADPDYYANTTDGRILEMPPPTQ